MALGKQRLALLSGSQAHGLLWQEENLFNVGRIQSAAVPRQLRSCNVSSCNGVMAFGVTVLDGHIGG